MRHLVYESPGRYVWQEADDPALADSRGAVVRPVAVAACDLDVAVARGHAPLPPGYAQGHEGIAEVVDVGADVATVRKGQLVVVPFQLSCGACRECRRGMTGSCTSVPPLASYGLGPLAGLDAGGLLADAVAVPFADAMLVALPEGVDPIAAASTSDNAPDGWRAVGPYAAELDWLDPADRRVLITGGLSVGLYAAATAVALGAQVDYVDTDPGRLTIAQALGATVHDRPDPDRGWTPYPVTVSTSARPQTLVRTIRATWPGGVCTDTGIYYGGGVELPLLAMYTSGIRFVTGRVNARAALPEVLGLIQGGLDLRPVVETVVDWADAPEAWAELRGKTVVVRS